MFIESNNLGDVLKYEAPNLFSREAIDNETLLLGTVLGQNDDGEIAALNLMTHAVAMGVAIEPGVMVTRDAIVSDHAIIWPTEITVEQKATAIKQLEARGVLIRQGV